MLRIWARRDPNRPTDDRAYCSMRPKASSSAPCLGGALKCPPNGPFKGKIRQRSWPGTETGEKCCGQGCTPAFPPLISRHGLMQNRAIGFVSLTEKYAIDHILGLDFGASL